MAISMDAMLRLKATVDGAGQIDGLRGKISSLSGAAAQARGGLGQMASGAGALLSPIRALVPAVSAVGLVTMAKGALDNADALSKMAQRTGASVEALSKFQKAAELSDSSIEGVGKGLGQLAKSMNAAQGGTGRQAEAFRALGINVTDANGKLKSTEEVMLEMADAFSKMPDGAEKTALAMALLGRGGMELIPMLNMGRKAIEDLGGSMTTEFALRAAAFNDKLTMMGQRFGELGIKLGEGLLPGLEKMADGLLVLIDAFSQLPSIIQIAIVGVVAFGPQLVAIASIIKGLIATIGGLKVAIAAANIGGLIAGWLPAIVSAVGAIIGVFKGLAVAILAVAAAPITLKILLVAGIVALLVALREPITKFFTWLWDATRGAISRIVEALPSMINGIRDGFGRIAEFFSRNVAEPIKKAWVAVVEFIPRAIRSGVDAVRNGLTAMINGIRNAMRGVLQFIANSINAIGSAINRLIAAFNSLPGPFKIPFVPTISVPQFAEGGFVRKATLAVIGEGGEGEYVIPESKMAAASARYLSGGRGGDIIPSTGSTAAAATSGGSPTITIQTGPVVEFNGERYVTLADLERAMRQTAEGVMGRLRTPSARLALGAMR